MENNDLLKAIEEQIEVWHIEAQTNKERIIRISPYNEGYRNGQIEAFERVLSLFKLGEVKWSMFK